MGSYSIIHVLQEASLLLSHQLMSLFTGNEWKRIVSTQMNVNNPYTFRNRKAVGLLHVNIRSLLQHQKLEHLKMLLSQADPDVLVLKESWLKKTDCVPS